SRDGVGVAWPAGPALRTSTGNVGAAHGCDPGVASFPSCTGIPPRRGRSHGQLLHQAATDQMTDIHTEHHALALDAADPLSAFRGEFLIPHEEGREQLYFCGNSLG